MQEKLTNTLQNILSGNQKLPEDIKNNFVKDCETSFIRQIERDTSTDFQFRMSSIGQDIKKLQCQYLNLEKDRELPINFPIVMMYGDVTEAIVVSLLKLSGINVQEEQGECELEIAGQPLTGTFDIMIDGAIWDVKSASDYSYKMKFNDFNSLMADDPFGYVSQLYLYAKSRKAKVGGWIVFNKSNGEFKIIKAPEIDNMYDIVLGGVEQNIITLHNTHSIDDIDTTLELEDEIFNRKETGRKILHSKYRFFDYKKALWGDKIELKANPLSKAKNPPYNWYLKE